MRRPGSRSIATPQSFLEQVARGVVGDVAIARQLVREAAHVAGALDVVLAAQRVHADAGAADIAGRHGEVGDRHHRRRALAVLGDAEAVIDRAVAAGRIEPRGAAQVGGGNAGQRSVASGDCGAVGDELGPVLDTRRQSQRSRMKASSASPSVTMTCAIAVSTATLVPGLSGR